MILPIMRNWLTKRLGRQLWNRSLGASLLTPGAGFTKNRVQPSLEQLEQRNLPSLFAPAVNYPVGTNPYSVAVGDFNGDGRLDLAVANEGDNNVGILLGNGDGTFRSGGTFATDSGPIFVVAADLNGDGHL